MNEGSLIALSQYIRSRGYKFVSIEEIFDNVMKLSANRYLNCGTHTICFVNDHDNTVIKCCRKSPETIIKTKEFFAESVDNLSNLGLNVLKPLSLIETKNYIIYTQPFSKQLLQHDVSPVVLTIILKMLLVMFKNQVKIADIYFKNFGIYENKVYLFDFHNVEDFKHSSSNFLITNLYCLFIRLGHDYLGWNVPDIQIITSTKIIADNYGRDKFPPQFYKVLKYLSQSKLADAERNVIECIKYLNDIIISRPWNDINYITNVGEVVLPVEERVINDIIMDIFSFIKPTSIIVDSQISVSPRILLSLEKYNPNITFYILKDEEIHNYTFIQNISTEKKDNYDFSFSRNKKAKYNLLSGEFPTSFEKILRIDKLESLYYILFTNT